MSVAKIIPPVHLVLREGLIVLGGVLIAAFIISRFPKVKQFVSDSSITVKGESGETYI